MIVKMIQDLRKRVEKMQEMFTEDIEELKNKKPDEQYTRRNQQQNKAEEWINDLEDRIVEITAVEQNIEKRMKRNEDSLRDLWDNIKGMNICTIGVPEGEERKDLRKYLKR